MPLSPHLRVEIDLAKVRANVSAIRARCGVPVIAVIKADAYGLGAARVAPFIADLVESFCVFSLEEALAVGPVGRPFMALGPNPGITAADFIAAGVRPAVWDVARAAELRAAQPLLCVDTGMQRFACPPEQIGAVLAAGDIREAFTHATSLEKVRLLLDAVGGRGLKLHAAGSSLLDAPAARLDAVRPGLALYDGAARVRARLIEIRQTRGPAGYSGFSADGHGVILGGYFNGLRPGPCLINGRPSRILETGMQSSYVQTASSDRPGDEVTLLGDELTLEQVARATQSSPHETLTRLCGAGERSYQK